MVNDTTLPSDNPLRFRKNLLNKYIMKPWQLMIYSFLVNDTTLPSDNPWTFRKNLLSKYIIKPWQLMIRLRMKNQNMILKAAKIPALSSDKIDDKHECHTGEEKFRPNQRQI